MISIDQICADLRDDVKALTLHLLPNGRIEGNYIKIGSVQGEPGQSMVIKLSGEGKGRWEDYSSADDHGDMLDLIGAVKRLTKAEAVAWAKQWLGIADTFKPGQVGPSPEEKRRMAEESRRRAEAKLADEAKARESRIRGARALYLRADSVPIVGTPADYYLRGRGLEPGPAKDERGGWPGSLRFHPEVWCKAEGVKLPAMLAPVYLADGTHVATHRTYLQNCPRRGWVKIDSSNAKMVLGPMGGGFVPINKGASGKSMRSMPAGEAVFVTEGIEDALVVRMRKPEARIVAAVTLGNIGAIVLPEAAKRLTVCCDRDENLKAQAALERALARQQARGIDVSIVMPPPGIKDLNDWLRASSVPQARGGMA